MEFSGQRISLSTMLAAYAGITSITWIKTFFFTPKDYLRLIFSGAPLDLVKLTVRTTSWPYDLPCEPSILKS